MRRNTFLGLKICKCGPLFDTCWLIFTNRITGKSKRIDGIHLEDTCHPLGGPSKCPVTQIRAFVGPRRSGEQDRRTNGYPYALAIP
ncbi:hypothetical protein M0802_009216 [Mischocyttarus mexicanus]|nr:hypothetical protein M0802_009216 [Mischocyttarus mexicanus]